MRKHLEIENIEALRRTLGIVDLELRREVHGLVAGDFVRVTLLNGAAAFPGETVLVRITSRNGFAFRGKLAQKPRSAHLAGVPVGHPVTFDAGQVHSVKKGQLAHGK